MNEKKTKAKGAESQTTARPLDQLLAAYARVMPVSSLTVLITLGERCGTLRAGERPPMDARLDVHVGNPDDCASRVGSGIGATVDEAAESALKTLRKRGAAI